MTRLWEVSGSGSRRWRRRVTNRPRWPLCLTNFGAFGGLGGVLVPRPSPGNGPSHDIESEGKPVDAGPGPSDLPRKNGGWFSGYRSHSNHDRCDRPNGSGGKQGMKAWAGASVSNHCG
jgi:hypothetical protein